MAINNSEKNTFRSLAFILFSFAGAAILILIIQSIRKQVLDRNELVMFLGFSFISGLLVLILYTLDISKLRWGPLEIVLKDKIINIENSLYYNRGVLNTLDLRYYWINENGLARVGTEATVRFLSADKGIVKVNSIDSFPLGDMLMDWEKTAKAFSFNGVDVFICFDDTLYYQSKLNNLYKLAIYNDVELKTEFKHWTFPNSNQKFVENDENKIYYHTLK